MAIDLDMTNPANAPFFLLAVETGTPKIIALPKGKELAVKHTGTQDNGVDPSVAGDFLVAMHAKDAIAANKSEGAKQTLEIGEAAAFRVGDVLPSDDGERILQLQAVTNGCMVQLLLGQITRKS